MLSPFSILIIVFMVALTAFPAYRIAQRAGFPKVQCVLFAVLAPFFHIFVFLALALLPWPNEKSNEEVLE